MIDLIRGPLAARCITFSPLNLDLVTFIRLGSGRIGWIRKTEKNDIITGYQRVGFEIESPHAVILHQADNDAARYEAFPYDLTAVGIPSVLTLLIFNFDVFDLLNTQINIPLSLSTKSWDFELGWNLNLPSPIEKEGSLDSTNFFSLTVGYLFDLSKN